MPQDLDIVAELQRTTHTLRKIAAVYSELNEPQQRSIRHMMYRTTGKFGKIVMPAIKEIHEIEETLKPEQQIDVSE